jgi:hypothetical protein
MALDPDAVCPACRRFWNGPPGQLPFPSPRGIYCGDTRHAGTSVAVVVPKVDPRLVEAYEIGVRDDRYATGRLQDLFPRVSGKAHRHEFGMSLAAEQFIAIETGRRWLNQPGEGGDVEGINVRWTYHDHGGLGIRPFPADKDDGRLWALVTGNKLEEFVARGWAYYAEVIASEWRSDWQYPAWCRPQRLLRPLSTIPPLEGDPWLTDPVT